MAANRRLGDKPKAVSSVLAAAGLLFVPSLAWAQYIPNYFPTGVPGYNQDMGVTVVTRVRPLYAERGVRLGGFQFYPKLSGSLGYNSNVAGTHEGPGSYFVETNPSLQIQSDWSRNSLGASFSADNFQYPNTTVQSYTNWQAAIGGGYTIGRGNLDVAYGHFSLNELPTDVGAPPSATPIPYTVDDLRSDYTFDLGTLKIIPNIDLSYWRFGSTTTLTNQPFPQSYRDRNVLQGGATLQYELSGRTSLLLVLQGSDAQFVNPQVTELPPLSSKSAMALGGIDYQYDGVWRYQLLAGMELRAFRGFANKTEPVLQGTVIWTPTGLTTITASALRTISDPTTEGSSGYVDSRVQIRVDHEYLRNVLLDGEAGFENAAYFQGGGVSGYYLGGGVTWLLNRNLRLSAHYQFTERSSGSIFPTPVAGQTMSTSRPYDQHLVLVQFVFGL